MVKYKLKTAACVCVCTNTDTVIGQIYTLYVVHSPTIALFIKLGDV